MNTLYEELIRKGEGNHEEPNQFPVATRLRWILNRQKPADAGQQTARSYAARKRTISNINTHDYSSESSLSPEATKSQDLPGYYQPKKRQKLFDSRFQKLILHGSSNTTLDIEGVERSPNKQLSQFNDPSATKNTAKSLTKHSSGLNETIPFEILSETILDNPEFQNILVENINSNVASTSGTYSKLKEIDGASLTLQEQLDQAMQNIILTTEQNPAFDLIVKEAVDAASNQFIPQNPETQSSSTPNKSTDNEDTITFEQQAPSEEKQPNEYNQNESIKQRLRPRKQNLNSSKESEKRPTRKSTKNIEVISNEYVGTLPESAMQLPENEPSVITINSDSEETVTTTSTQQIYQSGIMYILKQDPRTQNLYLAPSTNETLQIAPNQPQTIQTIQTPIISNNSNVPFCFDAFGQSTIFLNADGHISTDGLSINPITISTASNVPEEHIEPERNRVIVIDSNETNIEDSILSKTVAETKENASEIQNAQIKSTTKSFTFTTQAEELKIATPKQLIKSNNCPATSKSLSTPRHKNPHVRVLDFTTPARFALTNITESKNESSNASKAFGYTPQNRSISSSMPSSAPPKISSVQGSLPIEQKLSFCVEESSSMDTVIPFGTEHDEDTVISVGSETPKVRKKPRDRKACVRTLSAHKEINAQLSETRLKRLEKTKKKIDNDDDNCSDSKNEMKIVTSTASSSEEEKKAMALQEWNKARSVATNLKFFEQNLREQNSKMQEVQQLNNPNKRRTKRNRRKPISTKSKAKTNVEKAADTSIGNVSLTSSVDGDNLNSTELNLEAKLLEENLRSAKKTSTPAKVSIDLTKGKRKPSTSKMQIKLPQSPKVKQKLKQQKNKEKSAAAAIAKNDDIKETHPIVNANSGIDPSNKTENDEIKNPEEAVEFSKPVENVLDLQNSSSLHQKDDLEVAENLLNLKEVILQQEKEQNLRKLAEQENANQINTSDPMIGSVPVAQQEQQKSSHQQLAERATVVEETTSELLLGDDSSKQLLEVNRVNFSMSSLLETPYKFDSSSNFPKTPNLCNLPPQLDTPLLKHFTDNIMNDSIFKNPQFPTPTFPITPGSILTPFKDLFSPRSDQEIIYGAANRPTDYSSASSSYYKPDESDGVDKQIQSTIRSRTSGVCSADELDDNKKEASTTENEQHDMDNKDKLNNSSSSDSDSSDSDSDSSDSSSTSSNSSIASDKSNKLIEVNQPNDVDMEIKSHLTSTMQVGIAQNILESEQPVIDKEAMNAENRAALNEKRLRVQQRLRLEPPKTRVKLAKKKQSQKVRNLAEQRHERMRTVFSPSKRKLTHPKKVVSLSETHQVYSTVTTSAAKMPIETCCNTAVGLNGSQKVEKIEKTKIQPNMEEESVDAIEIHMKANVESTSNVASTATKTKETELSTDRLIEMLEDKRENAKLSPVKTKSIKEIDALPLKKLPRARPKNIIDGIITIKQQQQVNRPKVQTKQQIVENVNEKPNQNDDSKSPLEVATTIKTNDYDISSSVHPTTKTEYVPSSSIAHDFKTPAKLRRSQQLKDIFGDMSDIETPIKSPAITSTVVQEHVILVPKAHSSPKHESQRDLSKEREMQHEHEEQVSSNTKVDSDESSGDEYESDDEDNFESIFYDETDKTNFICILSSSTHTERKFSSYKSRQNFPKYNIVVDNRKIVLTVDEETELFSQEISTDKLQKSSKLNEVKENPSVNEPTSSTEITLGKPLQLSTDASLKKYPHCPKFNIKHKDKTISSP